MSKLLSFRLYVTVASGTDLNLKFLLHFCITYILLPELIPIISYMYLQYSVPVVFTKNFVAFMFCVRANTGSPQIYFCRYHQVLIIQFGSEL